MRPQPIDYTSAESFCKGQIFQAGQLLMVQKAPVEAHEHAIDDIEPTRLDQLRRVALGYGDAVGIIDALRIQGWSDDGLTVPQLRLLWALRDDDGLPVGALAEHLGVNPSTITG